MSNSITELFRTKAKWQGALKNLALLVVTLLVALALLELLVRTFIFDPNAAYIRTPGWRIIVRHNGLLRGVTENHVIEINRFGLRGDTPPGTAKPLIAVLGGSTVEDWVLPDKETWVKQFQASLQACNPNAWAANLGKGGVNARHHLIQLPQIMKYMPEFDMYVVLMGLNDFLFDLRIHHPFKLPKDWWKRQALMTNAGDEGSIASIAIAKRLYRRYFGPKSRTIPASDFGLYQEHLRAAYRKVRPDQWVDKLPDLAKHLATYRDTILRLKAFADSRGKPIVFVTQPYLWSPHMTKEALDMIYAGFIGADMTNPKTKWYTYPALERGLAAYNETLLTTCKQNRLHCVDAATLLPHEAAFFYDDFHFSRAGAARLGAIVAGEVKRQFAICRP